LKAHWEVLAAIDFTTVEVWMKGGLVTFLLAVRDGAGDAPRTHRWLHD